mmetsp:Transcript_21438/g.21556  ORF Transcript_21438/g.21556 Transcript_21438/m.21556 type:complete len:240 (+) Transcript_21438:123-842(+)
MELQLLLDHFESLVSRLSSRVQASLASKDKVADYTQRVNTLMHTQLRAMASLQGDIQPKLRKGVLFLRQLRKGDNQYFKHIELARQLPETYNGFLKEVVRRRQYQELFRKRVNEVLQEIQTMREKEIRSREEFMRETGVNIPPLLLQLVPSLKMKPQFLQASITESQWLPDINTEDLISLGIISDYSEERERESKRDREEETEKDILHSSLQDSRNSTVCEQGRERERERERERKNEKI